MQFESTTTQFISTYYFETKAKDKDNYISIAKIFAAGIIFPCATFVVFGYLLFFYSEWIANFATKYITNGFDSVQRRGISDSVSNPSSIDEKDKRIRIVVSLIIVSIFLSLSLYVFHIIASVKFIQYGNEVLHDDNDENDRDDQSIPILYVVFSFLPTVVLILYLSITIIVLFVRFKLAQTDINLIAAADDTPGLYLHYTLGGFLVYLGFYFSPYMFLSLIHDPIRSALIYMMLSSLILSIWLLTYYCLSVSKVIWSEGLANLFCKRDGLTRLFHLSFTLASGVSINYFFAILFLILTLGSFQDFQGVKIWTLAIFIGLLSYFVFSPCLEKIKSFIDEGGTDDKTKHIVCNKITVHTNSFT